MKNNMKNITDGIGEYVFKNKAYCAGAAMLFLAQIAWIFIGTSIDDDRMDQWKAIHQIAKDTGLLEKYEKGEL
jgi:hypothetical protein